MYNEFLYGDLFSNIRLILYMDQTSLKLGEITLILNPTFKMLQNFEPSQLTIFWYSGRSHLMHQNPN